MTAPTVPPLLAADEPAAATLVNEAGGGGENQPYSVSDLTDCTAPVHGERPGVPSVEVEIRQDPIAAPEGQAAWAARLARLLPAAWAATMRDAMR